MPKAPVNSLSANIDIQIQHWPIERLKPYEGNARTHSNAQINQIAASMKEFGWTNPILVDGDDGIIAGHARLLAAQKLVMTEVPVIVLAHLNKAQRRALVIADNQLALNAGWDEELLRVELAILQEGDYDLELLGFDDAELQRLLEAEDAAEGLTDEDAIPELGEVQTSIHGDLWVLGDHRVLCGDATQAAEVDLLIAGAAADLVFTDPPYNVDYEGYTEDRLKIKGDKMTPQQFQQFLLDTFTRYRSIVKPGASMYVCHSSSWQREFQNSMEAAGFEARCQIIWAKNTFAWGFGRYKFQHEPIFYAHVAGQKDAWYGDKSQSTLWEEKKTSSQSYPPDSQAGRTRGARVGQQQQSRRYRGGFLRRLGFNPGRLRAPWPEGALMEIDPKYADCIVRRWQGYTGKQAVLEGNGRTFDEIAEERGAVSA